MGRGILDIPASAGTGSGGDFIPNLYFKEDKESARIRFLTEHDEIFFAQFHDTNDPPFRELCVKAEFGQVCRRCDKGKQPRMKFLAWVFTYTHDYISEGDIPDRVDDYEPIKLRGGRKIYRVDVDEAQLICFSAAHKTAIQRAAEKYNTLLDREYDLIRSGEAGYQRTTYLLEGDDEEEMPEELEYMRHGDLPDLEKIASGEIESLDDDEEEEEEEERPRKRAKKTRKPKRARKEVEEEDDEDEDEEPLF